MYTLGKKSTIYIMLIIVLLLASCSKETQSNQDTFVKNQDAYTDIQKEESGTINTLYDFNLLYSYKNISLDDSDKVHKLVSELQYTKELSIDQIQFEIKNEGSLRINYLMNIKPGQVYKVNHTKMMDDMVILFALLDNLNSVEYNLVQENYGYGGVPITREQAEDILGIDTNSLGKTERTFLNDMPKTIEHIQWNPDVMNIIPYEHIMGLDD